MQKVLRRLTPRSVNTTSLPAAFMDLWENCDNAASRPNGDRSAKFNVSRYGVCYLDDIMVTIPQNWGIHCSIYISNGDGNLIVRKRGDGEEEVPAFVKLHEYPSIAYGSCADEAQTPDVVYAWAPRSRISDNQQRNLAIFRQQV